MKPPVIKAITIWQPWASLIAIGAKPYEFRSWAAPASLHGRRIAIHAGARPVRRDEVSELLIRLHGDEAWTTCLKPELAIPLLERIRTSPGCVARSAVVCTAILRQPKRGFDIVGEFGGQLNDSDRAEHCNWAWPLTDIQPVVPAVDVKGAQGFWNWQP
jgi:hypothetical protein